MRCFSLRRRESQRTAPTRPRSASRGRMPWRCCCSTFSTMGPLIAQIFFGLWLAPLGYLAYKSGMFPRALGVVLIVAAVSYLVDVLAAFSSPDFAKQIHPFLIIAPTIGEIGMVVYLLVWGVRIPQAREHAPIAPSSQTTIARSDC